MVDDNATSRQVFTTQISAWGGQVQTAADGPTALQILALAAAAGAPFQTAILDLHMPGMDGATLARAIRANAALQALRLIQLAPLGHPNCSQPLANIGFAACLTKPARKADLHRWK